jgi:predicted ATPase
MTRYTVACTRDAEHALAQLWLRANDRSAVANAANEIERELRVDATTKGKTAPNGFMQLVVAPRSALFIVSEDDRTVTIWSFDLCS